jgi:hypothetical protein
MTAIFIAVAAVLFWLAVAVQSLALARGAARGDAMLRQAVALERHRPVAQHRDRDRRIAA